MTLIELLITITIVSILSAAFLGTSNLAMESSRKARTKTTIGKIHGLLMEKWSEYATRRVDVDTSDINQAFSQNQLARGQALADLRLLGLRELMVLELPDSWSDILLAPVGGTSPTRPEILNTFPALTKTYFRRYQSLKKDPSVAEDREAIIANQGAECLYMIIMLATGDGEARTLFSEQDIGDTDDDGAPEFLDGWGRPIHFIRWPAGFVLRSDLMSGDALEDHDPFDVFRRDRLNAPGPHYRAYPRNVMDDLPKFVSELRDDNPAFRLVPLIYSSGPDGEPDIDNIGDPNSDAATWADPYAIDSTDNSKFVFGAPEDLNNDGDDNSLDNIHNHLQDNK